RARGSAAGLPERPHELVLTHLAASRDAERLRALVKLGAAPAFEIVVARRPSIAARGLALVGLQAPLQHLHQVDDLGLVLLLVGRRGSLDVDAALELALDQSSQLRSPGISELVAIDLVGR